jgi:hypothetical protein
MAQTTAGTANRQGGKEKNEYRNRSDQGDDEGVGW